MVDDADIFASIGPPPEFPVWLAPANPPQFDPSAQAASAAASPSGGAMAVGAALMMTDSGTATRNDNVWLAPAT